MHNAAFIALRLNWRYLAFEVHPKNLATALAGAKAMNFAGLNLTVPHKLTALNMMDSLDPSAKTFGAVNTVKFERAGGGKIHVIGFNTDADAIVTALEEDLRVKLRGASVLLLGAGGAGRTAATRLAMEKVGELFLVNRTLSKARDLARHLKKRFPSVKVTVGYPKSEIDLVVNATSLGLKAADPMPLDEKQFSLAQARTVYDMIYRPVETRLLATARKAGAETANGLGMLLHQGAKAFEIWTGKRAPLEVMRRALENEVYRTKTSPPRSRQ